MNTRTTISITLLLIGLIVLGFGLVKWRQYQQATAPQA